MNKPFIENKIIFICGDGVLLECCFFIELKLVVSIIQE